MNPPASRVQEIPGGLGSGVSFDVVYFGEKQFGGMVWAIKYPHLFMNENAYLIAMCLLHLFLIDAETLRE